MDTQIITIIVAMLGSTGLFTLAQYLISRHDNKNDRLGLIEKLLKDIELDVTRIRLRLIIKDEPKNHDSIMRIAHKYFIELDGDEEMFDVYRKWQKKEKVNTEWFDIVLAKERKK